MIYKTNFTTIIVSAIIVVFSIQTSFSQKLKILDLNTKEGIPYTLIKQQNKLIDTDYKGEIELKIFNKNNLIKISKLGYQEQVISYPKSDTTVYLANKKYELAEVLVKAPSLKTSIVGNYGKYDYGDWVNTYINKDNKFTLVNQLICDEPTKVNAILFHVSKDENYNHSNSIGPLEIVFFKSDENGMPAKYPFFNRIISKYSTGWNKIILPPITELQNISDTLFYGVRWVYHPTEYHYANVTKKKVYKFFGPKIGAHAKKVKNRSPTYYYTITNGWRLSYVSPADIALEIIN